MMMSMMLVVVVMITARAIAAIASENYHSPRPEKSMEGSLQGTHRYYRIYIYISLSLRVCVFESTNYNIYNYKTIMSFYFTTATPTLKLIMFTNFVI